MRIGQPGVEREQWNFDRERNEESEEQKQRREPRKIRHGSATQSILYHHKIKAPRFGVQP